MMNLYSRDENAKSILKEIYQLYYGN